ncbi:MAG: MlaD family protein [Candidatus Fibromonas sp.]|jgi:ABC-type transporter Mla subunit MlaD|nr:MlaD family protein [Candidatus Fibromonas sp.]
MNKDKITGVVTITAVLLLIAYVAIAMWLNERRARNTVFVQFHEMGALQNEDVVLIRGLKVGNVASITRANERALVEIDLDEPRIFRKDSKFRNISPNIMGSRFILIEPGKSGEPAPESYVFDGEFEPGFAEILALSDVAKQQVAIIVKFIRTLQTGDENNPTLQEEIESIVKVCEDLIVTLSDVVSSVEKQTIGALNRVGNYAMQISDVGIKINSSLDTIREQAQEGIASAKSMVLKINGSIESLNEILTQFENSPVTVALIDKREIIDDIDSLRSSLQAFVNAIDKNGIKIFDENGKRKSMVTLKNIHPFRETARSKAKKRAAKEAK